MKKLVLLRHGQSQWNLENRFTGWVDVPLSDVGVQEAKAAGKLLKEGAYRFDVAYTSVLKRAVKTCWIALEELDQMYIPTLPSWRLNERMYGSLQGLNKTDMVKKFGEEQVQIWRRSFDTPPPAMTKDDPHWPGRDPRYASVKPDELPLTESLKETIARFLPHWNAEIAPAIKAGKNVLIVAHGNSIRALVKHLDNISEKDIVGLNIPTGIPLVYELNDDLTPIKHYYLGDAEAAAKAAEAVAKQTKV